MYIHQEQEVLFIPEVMQLLMVGLKIYLSSLGSKQNPSELLLIEQETEEYLGL